jgi:hypothetical protein
MIAFKYDVHGCPLPVTRKNSIISGTDTSQTTA